MAITELFELLTPLQRESILAYARQLATTNQATVRGYGAVGLNNVNRKAKAVGPPRPIPDNRPKLHSAASTAPVKSVLKSQTTLNTSPARRLCGMCEKIVDANLYDEHLRENHGTTHSIPSKAPIAPDRNQQESDIPKAQSPGTAATSYPPGWFIDGRKRTSNGEAPRKAPAKGITQPARAHSTPQSKPSVKPPKKKKKKKKNKGAKSKGRNTQQAKKTRFRPRLLQGGLCNPR